MDKTLLTEGDVNFSPLRAEWYRKFDAATSRWLQKDNEAFLHQALSTPCLDVLEAAEGIWLTDIDGRRYMDFHGNNVHQVGHANPYVIEKVKSQMDQLPFSPRRYTNKPAITLAERLTALLPSQLNRVLFAPGGTSAVSMALKMARAITGREMVVSYKDSFHGASLDAIAAGGEQQFRRYMGMLEPSAILIDPPVADRKDPMDLGSVQALEQAIVENGRVGAFIAETVRNTDVRVPHPAYWKNVREICSRHGVMLILDEIPIAFGRTGKMFALEHFDIIPDILCLGKGLGAGIIPMAAMVTKNEYNTVSDISIGHFTHEKNPLGAAAGLAMLDFLENKRLLEKVQTDEPWIKEQMNDLSCHHECIGDTRGIGYLWAIELVKDRSTKEKAVGEAELVLYECLRRGLSFKISQGNVIQLSPPLTISRDEWTMAIDILDGALATAAGRR